MPINPTLNTYSIYKKIHLLKYNFYVKGWCVHNTIKSTFLDCLHGQQDR
jgi:hypothetical protein